MIFRFSLDLCPRSPLDRGGSVLRSQFVLFTKMRLPFALYIHKSRIKPVLAVNAQPKLNEHRRRREKRSMETASDERIM